MQRLTRLLLLLFISSAWAALPPGVTADQPTSGELSNGFKYLVLPHDGPDGSLSLRLVVRTGSGDEQAGELGYAHFVEHMAFNGSRHHPAGTLPAFFQRLGLRVGADLNASTSISATLYMADLPAGRTDHLDDVLTLFHDYADGLQFDPRQVDQERGVVLSELAARDTAAMKTIDAVDQALFAGTVAEHHSPAGTPQSVRAATAEGLHTFYDRTYRARRMTLIVVGAVDPAMVAARIEREFATLPSRPLRASLVDQFKPRPAELKEHVMITPATAGADLLFTNVVTRGTPDELGTQLDVDRAIAAALLTRRLRERQEEIGGARIGEAGAAYRPVLDGRFRAYTAMVNTTLSSWREGIATLAAEVQRIRAGDFSDAEIQEATQTLRKTVEHQVTALKAAANPVLATELVTATIADRDWLKPEQEQAYVATALATIDKIRVMAAARAIFPPKGGHLFVILPQPVPEAGMLAQAAWAAGASRRPATAPPAATEPTLAFAYTSFGTPGTITARRREPDLNLELGRFANGVEVNVRHSQAEPGRFIALVRLGRGLVDLPPDRPGLGTVAAGLVNANAPRRHKRTEIGRLLALHDVQLAFRASEGCGVFILAGPAGELRFALALVAAYVSDLDLRQANDQLVREEIAGWERTEGEQPGPVAISRALRRATHNDTRFDVLPDTAMLTPARFEETKEWLVRRWFGGPTEIGIVGDVSADDAFSAAAASVGTLPPRSARTPLCEQERVVVQPIGGVTTARAPVRAGTAVASAVWPAPRLDTVNASCAAQLAADLVADRLRTVLRDEKGATYAPRADVWNSREQPEFGYFTAVLTLDPDHAPQMANSMIAIADSLAQSGVSADDVERLRQPRLAAASAQMHQNPWWLVAIVSVAQSQPRVLENARGYATAYERVTLGEVNAALRYFARPQATAVVALPISSGDAVAGANGVPSPEPTGR